MIIREVEETDIPAILALVGDTITDPLYREDYTKVMDEYTHYYLAHKDRSAQYVAIDGDKIVGFALAGRVDEKEVPKYYFMHHTDPREVLSWVLLGQITVDADYRGQGVGSMLLDRIEERAREMKMKGVYTGTRGNTRLFYEKNDFVLDKVFLRKPCAKD